MGYYKNFDLWNLVQKRIEIESDIPTYFKEKDIWWTMIGVNCGFEEDGKGPLFTRPVIVLKKFNRELFIGIPLTTKIKESRFYTKIVVKGEIVSAMISQIARFSSKRLKTKMGSLNDTDFLRIKKSVVRNILAPPEITQGFSWLSPICITLYILAVFWSKKI